MNNENFYLFCDSHHGVYSWQISCQTLLESQKAGTLRINQDCQKLIERIANTEPNSDDTEELYWDIELLENKKWVFQENRRKYSLRQAEDIWAVRIGKSLPSEFYM